MEQERPLSSADMIRQAKESLDRPSMDTEVYRTQMPDIEKIAAEIEVEIPQVRPRSQPARSQPQARPRIPASVVPEDPFGVRQRAPRREPGASRAVAGAISLALVILGLAVFLALVAGTSTP